MRSRLRQAFDALRQRVPLELLTRVRRQKHRREADGGSVPDLDRPAVPQRDWTRVRIRHPLEIF